MSGRPFRILSIDGGGVRGILPAQILLLIEKELHIDIYENFDLVVGTSTGSIIASSVAIRKDLTELVAAYSENAPAIFQKRWSLRGIIRSKYNSQPLRGFLYQQFGDITLGEIEKPLIINAANISTGGVHVFKSAYQKVQRKGDYVRDGKVPLYKAVLASCAAPIYFDPVNIDGTLVCDGGIWANNPALVGYTDAIRNFRATNIKILSLGTGQIRQIYRPAKKWGFLFGWEHTKLVDFFMSCQTKFPQNVLELLDPDKILRISPEIGNYGLDKCENIPMISESAKSEFTARSGEILKFLDYEGTKNEA